MTRYYWFTKARYCWEAYFDSSKLAVATALTRFRMRLPLTIIVFLPRRLHDVFGVVSSVPELEYMVATASV